MSRVLFCFSLYKSSYTKITPDHTHPPPQPFPVETKGWGGWRRVVPYRDGRSLLSLSGGGNESITSWVLPAPRPRRPRFPSTADFRSPAALLSFTRHRPIAHPSPVAQTHRLNTDSLPQHAAVVRRDRPARRRPRRSRPSVTVSYRGLALRALTRADLLLGAHPTLGRASERPTSNPPVRFERVAVDGSRRGPYWSVPIFNW